jgi:hypothetical protein
MRARSPKVSYYRLAQRLGTVDQHLQRPFRAKPALDQIGQ